MRVCMPWGKIACLLVKATNASIAAAKASQHMKPPLAMSANCIVALRLPCCADTCAGPYRHYALYNRTYMTILSTPPRNWTGTPSSWKLQLDVSTYRSRYWVLANNVLCARCGLHRSALAGWLPTPNRLVIAELGPAEFNPKPLLLCVRAGLPKVCVLCCHRAMQPMMTLVRWAHWTQPLASMASPSVALGKWHAT